METTRAIQLSANHPRARIELVYLLIMNQMQYVRWQRCDFAWGVFHKTNCNRWPSGCVLRFQKQDDR
jgi:hypothetical protein